MAQKKYVSIEKLGLYHEKEVARVNGLIKTAKDEAIAHADSLASNYDVAGAAATVQKNLDSEIARAKAAEEANKALAETAQADVNALAGKVGEVAEGSTVVEMIDAVDTIADKNATDIVTMKGQIEALEAGTYDDTEVRSLISGLEANKADKTQVVTDIAAAVKVEEDARKEAVAGVQGEVDALEQTHATDKTALEAAIALKADQTTLDEVSETLDAVKADVDYFFKDALDDTDVQQVKDTLKELQEYIASDESGAATMAGNIQANADAIDAVEGRLDVVEPKVTSLEGEVDTLQGEMDDVEAAVATKAEKTYVDNADKALSDRITEIEGKFTEGEGSVEDMIADAVGEEATRVDGELAKKVDKVDGKGLSTNDLTNELKAQYDAAYAHSQEAHAPADAQKNVIETVKVNGVALAVTDKAVDVAVPVNVSELTNDKGYLVDSDIANKADKGTTLASYGIADAYTKTEVDTAVANAIGQFEECSEAEINALFA